MDNNIREAEDSLKKCLREQLDELEMLQSILCNPGELKVDDHSALADINDFLDGKRDHLNRTLDYTITTAPTNEQKIEVYFELPHSYPMIETPDFSIRMRPMASHKATRIECLLKQRISAFIDHIDKSTVYVYQIITWLQENYETIVRSSVEPELDKNNDRTLDSAPSPVELERLWIYSHHLKSMTKRQDMLRLAKQLNLNGFAKPGKPGIVCVEGRKADTQEFWKTIRQWSWQRITIRLAESKSRTEAKVQTFYRFDRFKEVLNQLSDASDHHVDGILPMEMSAFMKFLDAHRCAYVKKELLHLE